MSFARFVRFTLSERIQANNQYKLENLELRKQSQMVRTIFKAILRFSKQHIVCTDAMRHLTKTIDRHNGRAAFKQWCVVTRIRRETHLLSTEKDVVASLDSLVDGVGTL